MSGEEAIETAGEAPRPGFALPEPGTLIDDRYRVTRIIGSGGMGTVFEAESVSVGRRCAIKFLRTELAGRSRSASRFEREARLLARLEHEHVTSVIDYGHFRRESPYFVMEYLAGDTLRRVIERDGPLPLPRALKLIGQACRGMAYAHAEGVVHRDLKPDNLMLLAHSDGAPWIKILDFGVARWVFDSPAQLTPTGLDLGTAHYMSPEQARGAKDIDARTDVYALGATLYELLSGQRVHPGHSYNEILFQLLTRAHQPLCEVLPGCPRAVSDVVERCLRKDKSERYADCGEMLAALSSLDALSPNGVEHAVLRREVPSPARPNGSRSTLGGATFGLCAGVLATLLTQRVMGPRAHDPQLVASAVPSQSTAASTAAQTASGLPLASASPSGPASASAEPAREPLAVAAASSARGRPLPLGADAAQTSPEHTTSPNTKSGGHATTGSAAPTDPSSTRPPRSAAAAPPSAKAANRRPAVPPQPASTFPFVTTNPYEGEP